MVEDIVTTGLSSRETLAALAATPGRLLGAACLIDRSGGRADVGLPLVSLAQVDFPTYAPDALPDALKAIAPIKPGSRGLSA
jgi:orotate phosphoribosyltransferase